MADYLKRRREGWYFQIAVPRELRAQFNKATITVSLKTRDKGVAQDRCLDRLKEARDLFRRAREGGDPLSYSRVSTYAIEVYQSTLQQLEADARNGKHPQAGPEGEFDERTPEVAGLELAVMQIEQAIEDGDYDLAEKEIAAYEGRLGAEFELGLRRWSVVGAAVLEAKRAAYIGRSRALRGEPSEPFELSPPIDTQTLQRVHLPRSTGSTPMFADVAKRCLAEKQRDVAVRLTKQTEEQYRVAHRLFDQYAHAPSLDQVDRRVASQFLDAISGLNPHWGRRAGVKELTFQQIIEQFGGSSRGLANRTIDKYVTALGIVWDYASKRDGYNGANPWAGQLRPTTARRGNSRTGKRGFTPKEIAVLHSHAPDPWPAKHDIASTLPWLAWIGAYSGLRLNEITALDVEDLKSAGDLLYFDIAAAKSEAGVRFVPVHSALLAVGIQDYIGHVKSGPLFPALKPGGLDGKRGIYASKRFTVWRRKLRLVDIDVLTGRDRLEFHSLRRSAITALKRAGVPEADIAEIVGHEHAHVTLGTYADRHVIARLQAIVEAIRYPIEGE